MVHKDLSPLAKGQETFSGAEPAANAGERGHCRGSTRASRRQKSGVLLLPPACRSPLVPPAGTGAAWFAAAPAAQSGPWKGGLDAEREGVLTDALGPGL